MEGSDDDEDESDVDPGPSFVCTVESHLNEECVADEKHDVGFARPHTAIAIVGDVAFSVACTVRERPINSDTSSNVHSVSKMTGDEDSSPAAAAR